MERLYILYSAAAAAATVLLLAARLAAGLRARRRRSRDAVLGSRYLHILMLALAAGDGKAPRFPLIRRSGARLLLAETLAGVVSATYGLDSEPLRRIVAAYRLDTWLLRRVARSSGYRRARYLWLLAGLPASAEVAARCARYRTSRNRCVRFCALMTRLAADPSTALRLMADHADPFTAGEVAEIMTLLRRGMLPIAYEPLVESPVRNLRMVGLSIVRQFGIEEAEAHLLRIVEQDEAPELGREALYTLCSLRRPLARREVAERLRRMEAPERKALMRYMAREGYSPAALHKLFGERERPYYESLVKSYKRCLACR